MSGQELSRRKFSQLTGGVFVPRLSASSVLKSLTVARPSTRWEFDTDNEHVVFPGLFRDTSFIGETLFLDSGKTAYAVDRASGDEQWRFDVGTEKWQIGVGAKAVYATVDDAVYSLGAGDGSKRWTYRPMEGSLYSAIVSGETVYASGTRGLRALNTGDGTEQWKFEENVGTPTVVDDTVYGNRSETLYALDATDGSERWRFETDEDDHAYLRDVVDGTCYLWNHGTLYAVDASEGTELWRFGTDDDSYGFSGRLTEDTAYVWSQSEKTLYALDSRTGTARWQIEASSNHPPYTMGVVDDTVVVGTESAVYALDRANGTTRWRHSRQIETDWFVGDVDEETVYSQNGGALYALDLADGSVRWQFDPDGEQVMYAQRADDTVYAGTNAGGLYALEGPARTPIDAAVHAAETNAGPLALATLLGGGFLAEGYRRTKESDEGTDDKSTEEEIKLLERIDTDGPLETHRARLPDEREVVVKRLSEDANVPTKQFRRAVKERADLDHDGIAPVLDWGVEPVPWVALPDVVGESVVDAEEATAEERVEALATACEVVHVAHRSGITHGRLSPEDIRVASPNFDPASVRVGGWIEDAVVERDESSAYAAPEQVESREADPVRTDAYRLGAVAYHAITGQPPERKQPARPTDLNPDLPAELDEVLSVATATDPEERYRSTLKLADMLRWAVRQ